MPAGTTGAAVPASRPLVDLVGHWATTRPDAPAYTFVDYDAAPDGLPHTLTWADLHDRATALAARLSRVTAPGDRVAVLAPTGLPYVISLVAAWYAGTIAVPLFSPDLPGHADRLAASYADCGPAAVLTVAAERDRVAEFVEASGCPAQVLAADDDLPVVPGWTRRAAAWDDVAYLQYTSGSTRSPAGVEVSHRNLAANVEQIDARLIAGHPQPHAVNWLPLFHDMGLLASVAVPLRYGAESVLLDPVAFLMRPARWLRLMSGRPDAYAAAPNFAYDYVVRRVGTAELSGLDLSGVFLFLNGAEPVRPSTVDLFVEALAPAGLDPRAVSPGYGLAEATLFVASGRTDEPARTGRFDREALAAGLAAPARPGSAPVSTVASCGTPAGQLVAIVDAERGALPAGRVGEIWLHGPNVARGYWRQPDRTAQTFGAVLARPLPGQPTSGWLRTGDLGLLHDGELYVTGRLKDLIVVAGTNHYPQDIEATVAAVSPALGRPAAFAVTVDGEERAVVVVDRSRRVPAHEVRADAVVRDIRHAIWSGHRLALHDVVVTEPGGVPRTTSGKTSRTACRERWLAGDLDPVTAAAVAGN
jgi:fatty acid CoA ligase FadD32